MAVKNIKEVHDRLLAGQGVSESPSPEPVPEGAVQELDRPAEAVHGDQNDTAPHTDQPERPTVTELSIPLVKDGMGRWQVKSILRRRSMGKTTPRQT